MQPLPLPPITRPRRRRTLSDAVKGYGVGYNPAWPSILSVAHDESDGGRLFIVTDRPCVLVGTGLVLPLSVGGLAVIDAEAILPIKFRLGMDGAVPQGAAWTWGSDACDLIDPITSHAPNPGTGFCADVPGPYVPPTPANVIATTLEGEGLVVSFEFDRAITLQGSPPFTMDDAIQVNDANPIDAYQPAANGIALVFAAEVSPGSGWNINRTPAWCATPLATGSGTVG